MEGQIKNISELIGKTIESIVREKGFKRSDGGYQTHEMWLKFTDNTFVVFTENAGGEDDIHLVDSSIESSDPVLLELGLITKQEHDKYCEEERIREFKQAEIHKKAEQEWVKQQELKKLQELKNKYEKQ